MMGFFCYGTSDHLDLHVLTRSFPTRRSSDLSRSILNDDLCDPNDCHACVSMPEHAASDVSRDFIDTVERAGGWSPEYVAWTADLAEQVRLEADEMLRSIADECGVREIGRAHV